uniref:Uncharacterized protein C8orf76 homolog n=1 Tax=Crassostrea virginica TaxID=6565 RepID=A0A8B8CVI9_CRAVI|nr:uncharacterized protein C8orf76 homolog [Crassostrea virginica]XP_022319807.1 uncharacterized protein C8orf76 homolog [Crassostrea virginica]XP_022319808.1 uncharacterized protein C8orf76 homolog [Crassostrea virginica]
MELGLDFDDKDFIEEKKTSVNESRLKSYNAKVCDPLWFENTEIQDSETAANIYKFKGDHRYYHKQYEEAVLCYKQGLDNLPMTNRCMRHDLNESMARCYLALGKTLEALDLTQNLINTSTNPDQTTQACVLLQQIQQKQCDVEGEETTLKQLISIHPFNAEFWLMLKECYVQKFSARGLETLEASSQEYTKLLTCLVRARLLIRSVRSSVASFVKERHLKLIKEIEADLEKLKPSEACLDLAKKHLGEDIFKLDNLEDEKERIDQLVTVESVNFEDRWFKWNICT